MRTYRPDSYSAQARKLADRYMEWEDHDAAWASFRNSYRCDLIKKRVAKRMKRKGFQHNYIPTEYEKTIAALDRFFDYYEI